MNFTNMVKDSFKYPFDNISKWIILTILVIIGNITTMIAAFIWDDALFEWIFTTDLSMAFPIIYLIMTIYIMGYAIGIIKNASDSNSQMPAFNVKNDFINGLKHAAISIAYMIIPVIVFISLSMLVNGHYIYFDLIPFGFGEMTVAEEYVFSQPLVPNLELAAMIIISLMVFLVFALFEITAVCRFAKTGNLKEAFNLKEVFKDLKIIKAKVILAIIIIAAIMFIAGQIAFISAVLGIIITFLAYSYMIIFKYRLYGLIYNIYRH